MNHLKSFKELYESTSAGSFERDMVAPFKYSKIFDERIGYSKNEFLEDLKLMKTETDPDEFNDIREIIYKYTGKTTLDSVLLLKSKTFNILVKEIEMYLDSKGDFELLEFPDGYILCFEDIKKGSDLVDIYFNPDVDIIRCVVTSASPVETETEFSIGKFDFTKYGLDEDDFNHMVNSCREMKAKKAGDTPDMTSL